MDVDTRLPRYFAAVAEEGNLTRAAERLFGSQPARTKQVKQLETAGRPAAAGTNRVVQDFVRCCRDSKPR